MIAEELDDVPRELRGFVDLSGARRDPLARQLADQVADLALLVGERVERHARSLAAAVIDSLDVVAVGVEDKRAVVTRMPLGAFAGATVVAVARRDGDAVEVGDRLIVGNWRSEERR